jgi:predicted exporter
MATLKRIGVIFSAKLFGILMAIAGMIAGVLYSVGGFLYELFTGTLNSGTILAFGALIGMPLIFAATGVIGGAIFAPIYNLIARKTGGIQADLELAE